MRFTIMSCALLVLLISSVHGMFDKKKMQDAKNNPMVSMVMAAMGPDCESLYDKIVDKVDKIYKPVWNWIFNSCGKECGKAAEMQEAIRYLNYGLQFVDRLLKFLKSSSVKFDVWALCPRLVTKKVFIGYIKIIQSGCLDKKPHGYNVMHAHDLCHLVATESFNKTADCIKGLIVKDVSAKIMPPPMDCIGNVKKFCDKPHHPVILGWLDFFLDKLFKARNAPKDMKDEHGNPLEAEWNAYAVVQKWFNHKCKADKPFTSKYKMISA